MSIVIDELNWEKVDHLMPAIVQDGQSGQVLMLGYMNQEALRQTQETGRVTFFSRSKQRLWVKGEASGNFLNVVEITPDCDSDALLILASPQGPTCHKNTASCFTRETVQDWELLSRLQSVIAQRQQQRPVGSYTTSLFESGIDKIAQKVGEEGTEVVVAALKESDERLASESADLLFHLLVLLQERGLSWQVVLNELRDRLR